MRERPTRLFSIGVLLLLGWGALAFGSEYAWTYAPLLVWAVGVGLLGWLAPRGDAFPSRLLAAALGAVFVAALLQLVPLPRGAVMTVSPSSLAVDYGELHAKATMSSAEAETGAGAERPRPLSIAPGRTMLGLAFLGAFTMLFLGCTRGLSGPGLQSIVRGIVVLGVILGLAEVVQKASGSDVIYGFWYPPQLKGYQSAPFVNRNHTAGWLVMALSVSAGSFAGSLARGLRGVNADWRNRLLWFSTREASETVLTSFAIAVMAIAVVLTASRSGAICLALAILIFGFWVTRRQPSPSRKVIGSAYLVIVLAAAAFWGGHEVVAQRLYNASWPTVDGRLNVWKDTTRIIQDFPWTGTGFNTYGIAMLHYQTVQDGSQYIEAHNDYLQLAAEGGLLLGAPIVIAMALFFQNTWRRFRERADDAQTYWIRAGATTGLCTIAIQEVVDFTLQMPGAGVLFVVLAAIAIHQPLQASLHAGEAVNATKVEGTGEKSTWTRRR